MQEQIKNKKYKIVVYKFNWGCRVCLWGGGMFNILSNPVLVITVKVCIQIM